MFEPLIRWLRLNVPGADYLWFILNRKRIKRDFEAFKAMLEDYRKKEKAE